MLFAASPSHQLGVMGIVVVVHPLRWTMVSRDVRPLAMETTVSSSPWKPMYATRVVPLDAAGGRVARHRRDGPGQPGAGDGVRHHAAEAESGGEDPALVDAHLALEAFEHRAQERDVLAVRVPPAEAVATEVETFGRDEDRLVVGGALEPVVAAVAGSRHLHGGAAPRVPAEDQPIGRVRIVVARHGEDVLARHAADVDGVAHARGRRLAAAAARRRAAGAGRAAARSGRARGARRAAAGAAAPGRISAGATAARRAATRPAAGGRAAAAAASAD